MISGCTAYDLILVDGRGREAHPDTNTALSMGACMFRFGSYTSSSSNDDDNDRIMMIPPPRSTVYLVVHDRRTGDTLRFPISAQNTLQQQPATTTGDPSLSQPQPHDPAALQQLVEALTWSSPDRTVENSTGSYPANFVLVSSTENGETILGMAPLRIFVVLHSTSLAIVDVDGTITTSTLSGFWNTAVRQDYSIRHCHAGVVPFLHQLVHRPTGTNASSSITPTVQCIYLTNRPITYVDATRSLLNELREGTFTLPKGPLLGFTGNLAGVFQMDFYHVNAHEFKYQTLEQYVRQPFVDLGVPTKDIWYAGFGNTLYDMYAYHRAGIAAHRMFLIDKKSRIYACDAKVVSSSENDNCSKRDVAKLDHPKQYESLKGTLFATGYLDPSLMTYVLHE